MEKEQLFIKKINDELSQLRISLDKLTDKTNDRQFVETQGEILKVLKEDKGVQKELLELRNSEKNLKKEFKVYQRLVIKAIDERERNLRYLHKRVSVLEQATPVKMAKLLKVGLKNPVKLPLQLYKALRVGLGAVKRKLKRQKPKYNLVKLPFKNSPLPPSPFDNFSNDEYSELQSKTINELFLIGKYDSPLTVNELRIASILDDFSYQSFKHDCKLISFKPDNWFEVLTKELPHMLFVESAWQGNSGSWQYKIAKYNIDQGNELDKVLMWCNEHNVPTIFWNKEDPIHFEKFIDTAKKFDFIYTTDENCIPKYKEVAGHENVFSMPFGAQPRIHNPIQINGYKSKNVCFAGSYYANRHEDRKKDLEDILDAAKGFGLDIYDRNFKSTGKGTEHFRFPERFRPYIVGSLPYADLLKAYKQYKIFLNVNSVQNSGTMFSRRVFELLACGTTVVSTYAKGVKDMFGEIVPMIESKEHGKRIIEEILQDKEKIIAQELKGQRLVLSHHTYAHRLYQMANNAGFEVSAPYDYEVLLLSKVTNQEEYETILNAYHAQTYMKRKLVIIASKDINIESIQESNKDITVLLDSEIETNNNIFNGLTQSTDFIGILDPNCFYGPNYIIDLVQGAIYSQAHVVGKAAYYDQNGNLQSSFKSNTEGYIYCTELIDNSFIIRKNFFNDFNVKLNALLSGEINLKEYHLYGASLFAVNPFNFSKTSKKKITNEAVSIIIK